MEKIKYNNKDIWVDDSPLDEQETGILKINNDNIKNDLDKTLELKPIAETINLDDTLTNVWGNNNE